LAGKQNRQKRGPLTAAGRDRLRQAALEHQPWLRSTGPRSPAGKARAAGNAKVRQKGPLSVRGLRASLAEECHLVNGMVEARKFVAELLGSQGWEPGYSSPCLPGVRGVTRGCDYRSIVRAIKLHLVLVVDYPRKLLENARVLRYLGQHHPEIQAESQKLVESRGLADGLPTKATAG
jgi:hypothetical protein